MRGEPTADLAGGCACGSVRYRMPMPIWTHCCHCTWCQRETGSAFVINAMVEFDRLEVTSGTPVVIRTPSESGRGQLITRCPDCQVALWSKYSSPAIVFVRVGTLDDPAAIIPDSHIFTASKLPWVIIPTEAHAVPVFYSYDEVWPADRLSRRAAALQRYADHRPA